MICKVPRALPSLIPSYHPLFEAGLVGWGTKKQSKDQRLVGHLPTCSGHRDSVVVTFFDFQ